jgi:hypothetical protein
VSARTHRGSPQLTDAEFADAIRMLTDTDGVTVGEGAALLGMSRDRMRVLLNVVAAHTRDTMNKGKAIAVWTLVPDVEERIAARHELQRQRLTTRNLAHAVAVRAGRLAPSVPTWEGRSGLPHHFTTDGMGRVVAYVGPQFGELDLDAE